ncbi:hypothetical protein PCANB_000241 [Pneumocystis canis]|nr:hypothetical protein PCANB_000241 [Pneumocystis canis]
METKLNEISKIKTPYAESEKKRINSWPIGIEEKDQNRFFEWCLCFLVINFNIKLGQVLETAIRTISNWPSLKSNFVLELPFMGDIYYADIFPLSVETSDTKTTYYLKKFPTEKHISAFTFGAPLFPYFYNTIVSLYTIWEVILLGKPLLLLTDNPSTSTEMVLTLIDLIKPIKYSGDYRPYLTIQGSDFTMFSNHVHVIFITNENSTKQYPIVVKPTLKFIHRRMIAKDKKFLQKISNIRVNLLSKNDYIILNNFLLHYFSELTESFLAPIDKYLSTLIPTEINLFKGIPKLKPFKEKEFLDSLASYGPFIPFKKNANHSKSYTCRLFYSMFLKSPNFFNYLFEKQKILSTELTQKYFEYLCTINIKKEEVGKDVSGIIKLLKCIDKILDYNGQIIPENKIIKYVKTERLEHHSLNINIDYPVKLSHEKIKLLSTQRELLNDFINSLI